MGRKNDFAELIADWIIKDPESRLRIRESMNPALAEAWNQGYTAGYEHAQKLAYAEEHWYPEEDLVEPDNPFEVSNG